MNHASDPINHMELSPRTPWVRSNSGKEPL